LQFHSLDAQLAVDAWGRRSVCLPSARHWVRWAIFRKLESRMGKSDTLTMC